MILKIVIVAMAAVILLAVGLVVGHMHGVNEQTSAYYALEQFKDLKLRELHESQEKICALNMHISMLMSELNDLAIWRYDPPPSSTEAGFSAIVLDKSGMQHFATWNGDEWTVDWFLVKPSEIMAWHHTVATPK